MTVNLNTINEGERTEVKSENFSATTSQSQASTTLPVSNVVHVRNLPNDLTDLELINFAIQFGELTNYLVLVGKGQAFLEFTTLEAAKNAIDNASSTPPLVLKGRQLYFQYSKHSRLQTNLPNQQMVRNVTGIIENGGSFTTPILPNSSNLAAQVKMEDVQGAKDAKDGNMKDSKGANDRSNVPGPVLRVIVENLIMVVPLMTFHELFSRYGNVTKIVMFQRTRSQALIQFDQISSATVAKNALNGQQMFAGGNVLRIDYSMMQNLCVKFNNEKSRDFTTPSLPISSQSHSSLAALATNDSSGTPHHFLKHFPAISFFRKH